MTTQLQTEEHNLRPRVRPRRPDDEADLTAVLEDVHALDGYPVEGVDDVASFLNPPGLLRAWVAIVDETVVGHVALTGAPKPGHMDDGGDGVTGDGSRTVALGRLFVAPAARGSGAGRLLTRTATDAAQADGLALTLDVMAKDRAAIRLYESLGWQRVGMFTHHHSGDRAEPAFRYRAPGDLTRPTRHRPPR